MRNLFLALAFGLSLAAYPAAAFEGCGGYAHYPQTEPVASTEEATTPVTVAAEQTQPTPTAQISMPVTNN